MELFNALGLDWRVLLFQLINFAVLLWILHRFAYKPLLTMLDERSEKIEEGLKNADDATKKLKEASEKEEAVLVNAKKEAREIIAKAEETAKRNKEEILEEAKSQSKKLMDQAEQRIKEARDKMLREVKSEITDLVVSAAGKILEEKIDAQKDAEIIKKSLKDLD